MTREEFLQNFPGLIKEYQPATSSLKRIKDVSLLIIIGPSGVGKTSVINLLDLHFVKSDVTRKPRPGERDGVDLCFLTDYDQVVSDIRAGHFLTAVVGVTGDLYATSISSYPEEGWAVLPVIADVVPMFRRLGFAKTVSAFIAPPSYDEWMRRLNLKPIPAEQLAKRLSEAKRSLDFVLKDKETHFILNDDLEKAALQVKQLLEGKVDKNREDSARQAAKAIRAGIN